jgi:ketosteroid isomerase-like protein
MSQENVELVHRAFDAFNRRDWGAFLELLDADVRAVPLLAAIEGEGDYLGKDGVRRWWKNVLDVFPDFTMEAVEVRDLGNMTLAVVRTRGHGMGSETPVEMVIWNVAAWRDKKLVRWSSHGSRAGYWADDVAGERGDRGQGLRSLESS